MILIIWENLDPKIYIRNARVCFQYITPKGNCAENQESDLASDRVRQLFNGTRYFGRMPVTLRSKPISFVPSVALRDDLILFIKAEMDEENNGSFISDRFVDD